MTLTKNDLSKIGGLIDRKLDNQEIKFETKLNNKLDNHQQKFETKLTKFKSEFFEKIDPILKEVVTARDERTIMENRLENLEEIHQTGAHSIAAF